MGEMEQVIRDEIAWHEKWVKVYETLERPAIANAHRFRASVLTAALPEAEDPRTRAPSLPPPDTPVTNA